MLITDASSRFLHYLAVEKQVSPHTLSSYRRDLDKLCVFIQQQSVETIGDIKGFHLRTCLGQLHRQGLSHRSIQRWLSACRSFFKFALSRHWTEQNPSTGIVGPKLAKPLPKVLDPDQINQLLDGKNLDFSGARDLAMLELMYSCGLRLAELISLDFKAIDLANGELSVTGKGNKTRNLPIGRQAITALKFWYHKRKEKAK